MKDTQEVWRLEGIHEVSVAPWRLASTADSIVPYAVITMVAKAVCVTLIRVRS